MPITFFQQLPPYINMFLLSLYLGIPFVYIETHGGIFTKLKQDRYPISVCLISTILFSWLFTIWNNLESLPVVFGIIVGSFCFIVWQYIVLDVLSKSFQKQSWKSCIYGIIVMIYVFSLLFALVTLSASPDFNSTRTSEHQASEAHQMNQAVTKSSLDPLPTTYFFASIVFAGLELCKNVRDDVCSKM